MQSWNEVQSLHAEKTEGPELAAETATAEVRPSCDCASNFVLFDRCLPYHPFCTTPHVGCRLQRLQRCQQSRTAVFCLQADADLRDDASGYSGDATFCDDPSSGILQSQGLTVQLLARTAALVLYCCLVSLRRCLNGAHARSCVGRVVRAYWKQYLAQALANIAARAASSQHTPSSQLKSFLCTSGLRESWQHGFQAKDSEPRGGSRRSDGDVAGPGCKDSMQIGGQA